MSAIASQITSLTIVFSTVYLDTDQWKRQSSVSLASVRGIHRWSLNSPHKWSVTEKMFPLDDVITFSVFSLILRLCGLLIALTDVFVSQSRDTATTDIVKINAIALYKNRRTLCLFLIVKLQHRSNDIFHVSLENLNTIRQVLYRL